MSSGRRSARLASSQESNPAQQNESPQGTTGTKRKSEPASSPVAKRGKKSAPKQQTTIEESMDVDPTDESKPESTSNGDKSATKETANETSTQPENVDSKDDSTKEKPASSNVDQAQKEPKENDEADKLAEARAQAYEQGKLDAKANEKSHEQVQGKSDATADGKTQEQGQDSSEAKADEETQEKPAQDTSNMDDTGAIKPTDKPESEEKPSADGDSAVESHARDDDTPSEILEKGLIYFFIRGRVGIEDPSKVDDIARSYFILRPIPHGAKIGEGTIGSGGGKCRLLALPKKVLPVSGKDKFMVFVEEANTSFPELKENFLSASDYATQTVGVRHTPSVNPVAEGVYAITTTGRESHLAYILTIPQELGEVQKDIGLREQGSFVTSVKNPQQPGPANTNLPQGPDYPKEVLDEFRSLRWCPLQPKFLDYANAQFLLIGESEGIDKALQPQGQGTNGSDGDMKEEMEKLEGEDEIRIKHLKGDDAIFADLGVSKKDYNLQTTWNN